MRGAFVPKKVLSKIARNPKGSPRSIILCGPYGSGKTTAARIFAKALNCPDGNGDVDESKSLVRKIDSGSSGLYYEYNSSDMGTAERSRELSSEFVSKPVSGKKVVTLDEAHLLSAKAQGAFLTILEVAPEGVLFLFPTTHPQKLLDTIVSRSLQLWFEILSDDDMKELVRGSLKRAGVSLDEKTVHRVVRKAKGHPRDAQNQLKLIDYLGEEDYMEKNKPLDRLFVLFFQKCAERDVEKSRRAANLIVNQPLSEVSEDFSDFVVNLSDEHYLGIDKKIGIPNADKIIPHALKWKKFVVSSQDWYVFLLSFYDLVEEKKESKVSNRFSKV